MFTWFVSLVMLFTNRGVIPTVPSAGLNTSGEWACIARRRYWDKSDESSRR
jgi:hypothetical protein